MARLRGPVLADPRTAGILVSVLARGPAEPNFSAARRGLLGIGEPAWMDLLRVANSTAPVSRREAALVLSEQGVPQVASTLMAVLTDNPGDNQVAFELATLTCIDLRSEPDPAGSWWEWWDQVRHDDSLAWFRAALARQGLEVPPAEAFLGAGVGFGILWLVAKLGTWLFKKEAMGGGDLKMMGMVGAFLGVQGVLLTLFLGAFFGSVVFGPISWKTGKLVPFGIFLAVGASVSYGWGDAIIQWYTTNFLGLPS